jgi:hypothetical protein
VQGNGNCMPNSDDKGRRQRGAKVGEARGEQTAPVCGLGWGRGGPRQLAGGVTEPTAGAGDGGGAPVRKRAWGSVVQLRWEVEKVMGRLVWAMWMRVVTRRSWVWAESSGGLRCGFIGARGRMVAWARAAWEGVTKGQSRRCGCLTVAGVARRGTSSARGRTMPPRGGFLRGRARFCGPAGDLQGVGGSTWLGASVAPGCAGQLACRRWDRVEGGERREKVMGLVREKQK